MGGLDTVQAVSHSAQETISKGVWGAMKVCNLWWVDKNLDLLFQHQWCKHVVFLLLVYLMRKLRVALQAIQAMLSQHIASAFVAAGINSAFGICITFAVFQRYLVVNLGLKSCSGDLFQMFINP